MLGLYGEKDPVIPVASVEQMRAVLEKGNAASRASKIELYPDAGHAFFADYRPNYEPKAAADGWKKTLAWLKAHGV